jgi:NAD(P) transhydrogenase subunit alpha
MEIPCWLLAQTEGASSLVINLTVFVLAVFVGFEIITKVPPTLHTPLMSGSNAISGITVVGALIAAGAEHSTLAAVLGMLAVVLAMINVVGGFLVTHRMLGMFRGKPRSHDRATGPDREASSRG